MSRTKQKYRYRFNSRTKFKFTATNEPEIPYIRVKLGISIFEYTGAPETSAYILVYWLPNQ